MEIDRICRTLKAPMPGNIIGCLMLLLIVVNRLVLLFLLITCLQTTTNIFYSSTLIMHCIIVTLTGIEILKNDLFSIS